MEKPLLELSTQPVRPQVIIDSISYGLVTPQELSFVDLHVLEAMGRKMVEIGSKKDATEEEMCELSLVLDALCRKLLPDAADEIHGKLNDQQRMAIGQAFMKLREG